MAKIFLNIEAEDVRDLHSTMGQILEGVPVVHSCKGEPAVVEDDDRGFPGTVETGEEKVKRTRRTKAQIEADNAAAAGAGSTGGLATPASDAGTGTEAGTAGITGTTGQKAVDPFAEQIKESAKEPAASEVTNAQVRAAMTKYLGANHTAKECAEVLQRVGGVPNLGALDPSHYAAALAAFEAG